MRKTTKKLKQGTLQKFSYFINEFKLGAELDPEIKDWNYETKELIDDLCYKWNDWCFKRGLYMHGRLLLIEINVIGRVCKNLIKVLFIRRHIHIYSPLGT